MPLLLCVNSCTNRTTDSNFPIANSILYYSWHSGCFNFDNVTECKNIERGYQKLNETSKESEEFCYMPNQLSLYWYKREVDEEFRENLEISHNLPYCASHNWGKSQLSWYLVGKAGMIRRSAWWHWKEHFKNLNWERVIDAGCFIPQNGNYL